MNRRANVPAPASQLVASTPQPIVFPTKIMSTAGRYTISKSVSVPCTLLEAAALVRPDNWRKLSPMLEETQLIEEDVLFEKAVLRWNRVRLQTLEVFLRVHYTLTEDVARTDYSLMYERNNRILVDEGYGEARVLPGKTGWIHYTALKTIEFSSRLLNSLAAEYLSTLADQAVGGLLNALEVSRR